MADNWLIFAFCLVIVLLVYIAARKQNREAEKQGGRNPVRFRIGFYKKPFQKEPEELYTEDRKINRDWKR